MKKLKEAQDGYDRMLRAATMLHALLDRIIAASRRHDKEANCYDPCDRCQAMADAREFLRRGP